MGKTNISVPALEALERLKRGNEKYMDLNVNSGDVSLKMRAKTARDGQNPYAVVFTCSDSRVIPESIFSAGIGDIFVIRTAGNFIAEHQLGSMEYAIDVLGIKLILVLGHTDCGAVNAAVKGKAAGKYIRYIVKDIRGVIGEEKDTYRACLLNVRHNVSSIENALFMYNPKNNDYPKVIGAIYNIETGKVEFL